MYLNCVLVDRQLGVMGILSGVLIPICFCYENGLWGCYYSVDLGAFHMAGKSIANQKTYIP